MFSAKLVIKILKLVKIVDNVAEKAGVSYSLYFYQVCTRTFHFLFNPLYSDIFSHTY